MDFKTQLVYQAAKLRLRKIERYTAEAEPSCATSSAERVAPSSASAMT